MINDPKLLWRIGRRKGIFRAQGTGHGARGTGHGARSTGH